MFFGADVALVFSVVEEILEKYDFPGELKPDVVDGRLRMLFRLAATTLGALTFFCRCLVAFGIDKSSLMLGSGETP